MENASNSNTVWCIVAFLAFALIIAALIQARMRVRLKVLNDTSDCCSGGSWRNDMTFITSRANAVRELGMTSALIQPSPRNTAIGLIRAHGAPAHGKECTPC
jgi:hypothetical protein